MIQAGVKSIKLFSALDVTYDTLSDGAIHNISGTNLDVSITERPSLSQTPTTINREVMFNVAITLIGFGIDFDLKNLKNKFGWLPLIVFFNGDVYFHTTPFFLENTELDSNVSHSYPITLKPNRPTVFFKKALL